MKFYDIYIEQNDDVPLIEEEDNIHGKWAKRATAEQAARDVVDLAKAILGYDTRLQLVMKAQAVIERYEGGRGNE